MRRLWPSAAVVPDVAACAIFRAVALRRHDPVRSFRCGVGLGPGAMDLCCVTTAPSDLSLPLAHPVLSGTMIGVMVLAVSPFFDERISPTMGAGRAPSVLGIVLRTWRRAAG